MKKTIISFVSVLVLSITTAIPVFGAYTSTLEYKGAKADAELVPKFQWSVVGSDKATATTEFTTSNKGFRVAVRLERWDDKKTMGDYKYDSDSQIAQTNYTWTDVYAFQSRHSIDNSTNTKEYAVDAFNAKE
jgi:hypothetical protein